MVSEPRYFIYASPCEVWKIEEVQEPHVSEKMVVCLSKMLAATVTCHYRQQATPPSRMTRSPMQKERRKEEREEKQREKSKKNSKSMMKI